MKNLRHGFYAFTIFSIPSYDSSSWLIKLIGGTDFMEEGQKEKTRDRDKSP